MVAASAIKAAQVSEREQVTVWLRIADVSDELGLSARTVLRWVDRGHLTAIRLPGGQLRIARCELDRALERWVTTPRRILTAVDDEGGTDADG